MAITLQQYREKYPQFNDVDDTELATALHKKYYPSMPFEDFSSKIGVKKPVTTTQAVVGRVKDTGVDLAKGVVGFGQSAVGLASLATGGLVGEGMRSLGYDPQQTTEFLDNLYSDARKLEEAEINKAEGFVGTAKALIKNPIAIAGKVVETAPMMLGSIGAARLFAAKAFATAEQAALKSGASALAAKKVATEAAAKAGTLAASIAEGAQQSGSSFDDYMNQGVEIGKAYVASVGSGITTALGSLVGGTVGKKLGLGDVEAGIVAKGGIVARTLKGGAQEGLLEESNQSATEQMWNNYAMGKPLTEGVAGAVATGTIVGAAAGGGFSLLSKQADDTKKFDNNVVNKTLDTMDKTGTVDDAIAAANDLITSTKYEGGIDFEPPAGIPKVEVQDVDNLMAGLGIDYAPDPQMRTIVSGRESDPVTVETGAYSEDQRNSFINQKAAAFEQRIAAGPAAQGAGQAEQKAPVRQPITLDDRQKGSIKSAYSPKGAKIDTQYAVVEAGQLLASNDEDGNVNPDYPAELQPRDRSRKTSKLQIDKIAKELNPELLGESATISDGAPIIGPDGVIESGNGRVLGVHKAYRIGKGWQYKDYMIQNAGKFGLDPEQIKAMENPVLVRVRQTDVDRATFTKDANQSNIAELSSSEKAKADAWRIDDNLLKMFQPNEDGNVLAASNTKFIQQFLKKIGDQDTAGLVTNDGKPTKQLLDRINSAIFSKVYGNDKLLALHAEGTNSNIKNIVNAMTVAAPQFAKVKALDPDMGGFDITTRIADAANLIQDAATRGMTVDTLLAQQDAFSKVEPQTAAIAMFMHENSRSVKRMGDALTEMGKALENAITKSKTTDIFGDKGPDFEQLLDQASKRVQEIHAEDTTGDLLETGAPQDLPPAATAKEIDAIAAQAATSPDNDLKLPTKAQEAAENFTMAHPVIHGMPVTISYPKGSKRSGTSKDGKKWERVVFAHYGHIPGTIGADGENIDIFIGPNPESTTVYVVYQTREDGTFDEHKAMFGYLSEQAAKKGYLQNYPKGWDRIEKIVDMSVDKFNDWKDSGKPAAEGTRETIETNDVKKEIQPNEIENISDDNNKAVPPIENVFFTEEKYQAALARMKSRLNTLSMNPVFNPDEIEDMVLVAGYHIERGARTFAQFSKVMIQSMGEKVRPYLQDLFDTVRNRIPQMADMFADQEQESQTQTAETITVNEYSFSSTVIVSAGVADTDRRNNHSRRKRIFVGCAKLWSAIVAA